MADDIDRAQGESDIYLAQALQVSKKPEYRATGLCIYCKEACNGLFCDHDCKSDWEHQEKLRRINGR